MVKSAGCLLGHFLIQMWCHIVIFYHLVYSNHLHLPTWKNLIPTANPPKQTAWILLAVSVVGSLLRCKLNDFQKVDKLALIKQYDLINQM